jgi:hypothetical protein
MRMAWRGWRASAIAYDSRSSTSFSPHLNSSRTPIKGFSWGFPIVSPFRTPYLANHISILSLPRLPPTNHPPLSQLVSGSSTSPRQPFGTPAATPSSWGYPPALDNAKLQVSLVTTLSISALSILLVSLWPNASSVYSKRNLPCATFKRVPSPVP